jgi:hypothetical protein
MQYQSRVRVRAINRMQYQSRVMVSVRVRPIS